MKKLFLIAALTIAAFNTKAQTQYPFGPASFPTVTVTSKVTAQALTVTNTLTYFDLGTVDTNKVVTITGGTMSIYNKTYVIPKGAMVFIKYTSDGTARSITPSTGFTGVVLSGTISKTKVMHFIYDGTNFIECSTPIQIN